MDELHDRVQLAGIKECPVSPADVDDYTRDAREVDPVHHLAAADARPVFDARGRRSVTQREILQPLERVHRRRLVQDDGSAVLVEHVAAPTIDPGQPQRIGGPVVVVGERPTCPIDTDVGSRRAGA